MNRQRYQWGDKGVAGSHMCNKTWQEGILLWRVTGLVAIL